MMKILIKYQYYFYLAALFIVGFIVYWPSLKIGFLSDDWGYVYLARHTKFIESFKYFFIPDSYGAGAGNFRPLVSFLTTIIWPPFFSWPQILHAIAISLHCGLAFLVACWFWFLFQNKHGSVFAGFLFLLYPLNTETVVWLCANNAIFAMIPLLLALIFYTHKATKKSLVVVTFLVLLSLLAKEYGLLFVLFAIVIDFIVSRQKSIKRYLIFILIDIFYFGWRFAVLGKIGGYAGQNGSLHTQFNISGFLLYLKLPWFYLHRFFNQQAVGDLLANTAWLLLAICLLVYLISFLRHLNKINECRKVIWLGLLIFAANLLGWNLLNAQNPSTIHSRILYFSNICFAIFFSYLFFKSSGLVKKSFFIIFLIILAILTRFQIQPWVRAGQVTQKINSKIIEIDSQDSKSEIDIINLPDNYQGAFIYRNGIEYFIALIKNINKEDIRMSKSVQSGLSQKIIINGNELELEAE